MEAFFGNFVLLFAVIDPIGTVPVFIAVTRLHPEETKEHIATRAVLVAGGILIGFMFAGQIVLDAIDVPLTAFEVAGGIVLFLFALTMIFGDSKPEEELKALTCHKETAVFPLAVPSIASPGAMMAVVVLTDNHRFVFTEQMLTLAAMLVVLLITWVLLVLARHIYRLLGESGASIVSRVMGMILASVATTSVLDGIQHHFNLAAG